MKRLLLLITLVVAATAQTTFKVDVELVRLMVTVKDLQGKVVGTLTQSDFTVYDSGLKQDVAVFEHHTSLPLSVSLLLDNSGSTAKDLRYETQSIEKFFKALFAEGNPTDAAALYEFNSEITRLSSFTRREARLTTALKDVKPEGGTSVYDAIYLASKDVEERDGRHVIVIVTDGGDTTSYHKAQDALQAAHLADAIIYPILVVPITNDAGRNTGGEHALEFLATGTGGKVFTPAVGKQLDAAFTDILRDLRTQYLIGYYPKEIPLDAPTFHPVRVDLVRQGSPRDDLRAQTRAGYYGSRTAAK